MTGRTNGCTVTPVEMTFLPCDEGFADHSQTALEISVELCSDRDLAS
jgi:hypothetical protein